MNDFGELRPFQVHVDRTDAQRPVIAFDGQLDDYNVGALPQTAPEVVDLVAEEAFDSLVYDLSNTSFIDSAGLQLVVDSQRQLQQNGKELVLRNPSWQVSRLLEITKLVEQFPIEN